MTKFIRHAATLKSGNDPASIARSAHSKLTKELRADPAQYVGDCRFILMRFCRSVWISRGFFHCVLDVIGVVGVN
ncbi:hypothetical protein [uncultured Roseobacter sp.]|uniref:hypothetical protein n=1 Tax=uncultured Roseobacter sp. TaxID=114847 RepID=UPI00263174B8|nr:hypothetical protein [uncultured Roseobacter sp.]